MKTDRLLDLKKLKFEVRDIMRYDDVGDYFDETIVAYDFKDDVITNAIFLHEFIEYTLTKSAGISPELIDTLDEEPGSEDRYPKEYALYMKFHRIANAVEKQFIENLGLKWEEHDRVINTAKVKVAIQKISNELHKENPSEKKIEKAKEDVKDAMENQ